MLRFKKRNGIKFKIMDIIVIRKDISEISDLLNKISGTVSFDMNNDIMMDVLSSSIHENMITIIINIRRYNSNGKRYYQKDLT